MKFLKIKTLSAVLGLSLASSVAFAQDPSMCIQQCAAEAQATSLACLASQNLSGHAGGGYNPAGHNACNEAGTAAFNSCITRTNCPL